MEKITHMYAFPNAFWVDGWFWDGSPTMCFLISPTCCTRRVSSSFSLVRQRQSGWRANDKMCVMPVCFVLGQSGGKCLKSEICFQNCSIVSWGNPHQQSPKQMNPPNWSWWNMINWTQFVEGAMDPSCLFISPISGCFFLRPNLTNSALVHWHRFIIQLHKMGRTFWYLVMSSHSPHTEMFIIPIPNYLAHHQHQHQHQHYQHHDLWRNDWPSICVDLRDSHANSHPWVSQWGGAATQIWHFLQYWG